MAMANVFLLTFLIFCASNLTLVQPFDYFKLVLQWPNSFCTFRRCQSPVPNKFTIHGLWPDDYSGPLSFCTPATAFSTIVDAYLLTRLSSEWPNLIHASRNQGFWKRQWDKHGTCSLNLYQQNAYFEKALELKNKFDVLAILASHGIFPTGKSTVSISQVNGSVFGATGQMPIIKCNVNGYLTKIIICFNPSGDSVDPCPQPPIPSCGSTAVF